MFKFLNRNKKRLSPKDGNNASLKNEHAFHVIDNLNTSSQSPPLVSTVARETKQVLRGSKLRFTEDARYNLKVLKSLVISPNLVAETITLGTSGPKEVIIMYLDDIANPGHCQRNKA